MRRNWGWTESHLAVVFLLLASGAVALAGLADPSPVALWVAVAVFATGAITLALDGHFGLVVGLVMAFALAALRQLTGHWVPAAFLPALVESIGLVVVGGLGGATGQALRRSQPASSAQAGSHGNDPYGPLGLISAEAAHLRLEEEIERASEHHRPLSLVLVAVEFQDPATTGAARTAALRATARVIERRASDVDVPFALTDDRIGVIFPERPSRRAWEAVGDILHTVGLTPFTAGADRTSRALADTVSLHVGVVQLATPHGTAAEMMQAAWEAAARAAADDGALT
jgi:GGDEF domain-containing protein